MKVILIKDCKDGKINEVVEVSNGYATNFLIKTGLGVPYNKVNSKKLNKKLREIDSEIQHSIESANKVKTKLESLNIVFKLKVVNMVVHGSVTRKQISKELHNKGINIQNSMIENVKIAYLGNSEVKVNLHKDVVAKLIIKVEKDEK